MTVEEQLTEAEQTARDFVTNLEALSEAAEAMLAAGLTRRAIVILLKDQVGQYGPGKREIHQILDALPHPADAYLERDE